jgi:hypothetical protein
MESMKTKIIITCLLLPFCALAQYGGFQLLSVTPTGGGDSRYVCAQKDNSNSYYWAGALSALSNTIVVMQTAGGWTNSGVYAYAAQLATNTTQSSSNSTQIAFLLTNQPPINGAQIIPSTVNSNALDNATFFTFTNTAALAMALSSVAVTNQPDSGGMGGTTFQIKASDNGSTMYLHVTSLGVITATSSP